ncbi:hypothetical protein GN316_12975 [Xylophilus sp. Kf1]|nr:hypothetical protein [Xylophilus sp. Kf1]
MRFTVPLAGTWLAMFAALPSPVVAQDWFTISGYPELPGTDVVQISPVLTSWQQQVTLEVRTTRKADRTGYGGVVYRSYSGMAAVDCQQRKGWFLSLSFYSQPNWEGPMTRSSNFRPEEAPMVFLDIPGAPAERLINAACAASR